MMNIKNKSVIAIAVAMMIGGASAPAFAVEHATKDMPAKEGRMPPKPHQAQWDLFRGLDLTKDQQEKIQDIMKDSKDAQRDAFKDGMKYNADLRTLAASDDYTEDKAKDIAEDGAKVLTKAAVERAESEHKVFEVLTAEQREKYKDNLKRQDEMFKKHFEKMEDRKGDIPPPPPAGTAGEHGDHLTPPPAK